MIGSVSLLSNVFNYGKRIIKATPEMVFGTAAEYVGQTIRNTPGGFKAKAEAGLTAMEYAGRGNFFKTFWGNCKTFFPEMKTAITVGTEAAKAAGKNTIWGGAKGLFKGLGKKMPFIFAVTTLITEAPNIITAVKDKGLWQGVKEVGKSGAKLVGAGLGAAIGSAVCPGIGSFVGWIAGEWLAGKIAGKSYSEQKAQAEGEQQQMMEQQQQQAQNPYQQFTEPYSQAASPTPSANPTFNGASNPFAYQQMTPCANYSDDIMLQGMNTQGQNQVQYQPQYQPQSAAQNPQPYYYNGLDMSI